MNEEILKQLLKAINSIVVVVDEVSSHNCYGKEKMFDEVDKLRKLVRKVDKQLIHTV